MKIVKIVLAFAMVLWAAYITSQIFLIRAEVREACSNTQAIETRLALGKFPDVNPKCP